MFGFGASLVNMAFYNFRLNLRDLLKKVGHGVGLSLKAVRIYTRQLLQALLVLHQLGIIHCDIKPDNILISPDNSSIRLCDFGIATDVHDGMPIEPTPYLASRFYRAPEISASNYLC